MTLPRARQVQRVCERIGENGRRFALETERLGGREEIHGANVAQHEASDEARRGAGAESSLPTTAAWT